MSDVPVCFLVVVSWVGNEHMIQEHDCIVLIANLPAKGLAAGDVGTIVHIHPSGAAYEVEFMTITGKTIAVTTVLPTQLRPAYKCNDSHDRELAASSGEDQMPP